VTRDEARATLGRLAATVREQTEDQAAVRLLERISGETEADVLRDALVELGVHVVLRGSGATA
jgi:hypothetical protein